MEHRLVTIHDQLVRSTDQIQLVGLIEVMANIPAKQEARAPRAQSPPINVLWI